jgi:Domain of unknown function (DUF1877)
MGMICELYVIDDEEIKMLINSPTTFEEYLSENLIFASLYNHTF